MSGTSRPTIAAVVPVHNKGPFVERALASIAAQTRQPDEILVVDDASTDDSAAIIARFHHPAVRALRRESPSQSAARNLAIGEARSDWIAFLDADDEWRPTYLADIETLISDAPASVGLAFTGYEVVEPQRRYVSGFTQLSRTGDMVELDLDGFLDLWLELGRTPVSVDTTTCRRQLLADVGLWPEACRRGADVAVWLRVIGRATARALPTVGAVYYRDTANIPAAQTADGRLCLKAAIDELLAAASPATAARLRRLYNQYAYQHVRRRAGNQSIAPASYDGFFVRDDPLRYLAIKILERTPPGLVQRARGASRALTRRRRRPFAADS